MTWRVANSLLVLRDQINAAHPGRSKASDGTIGDPAHQSQGSASDHNPWLHLYGDNATGVVTALDITHDPAAGCDINVLTDELAASRDPRIKYLIANALILSGNDGPSPWVWRPYGGSDPHTNHMHLSVVADPRCDDTRPWGIASAPTPSTGGDTVAALMQDGDFNWLSWRLEGLAHMRTAIAGGLGKGDPIELVQVIKRIDTNSAAAAAKATPVTMTDADRTAIADLVMAKLQPLLPTAAQVADELAKRLGNG